MTARIDREAEARAEAADRARDAAVARAIAVQEYIARGYVSECEAPDALVTAEALVDAKWQDIGGEYMALARARNLAPELVEALRNEKWLLEGVKRAGWVTSPSYSDDINLGLERINRILARIEGGVA